MNEGGSHAEQVKTLEELVGKTRFAMLTTTAADGTLVSRPMTVQEFKGSLFRIVTQARNHVAKESDGHEVNLTIVGDSSWVSVSGRGALNSDVELKKRLWDVFNDSYCEGGPENPDNVILEVDAHTASYWDSPGGVGTLLGVLAAQLTGGKPPTGEYGTVEL